MTVDIYIKEKSGTREIRIPLLPEELPFESGDTVAVTYDVMDLGEVAEPAGTELSTWSWKSEFPGEGRKSDPMLRGTWQAPNTYDAILRDWQKNGTELNMLVTGYPINADVYIKEYRSSAYGAFGDIAYEIAFFEARNITITTTNTLNKRLTGAPFTYTIKDGDTLWSIARQSYGSGMYWQLIYSANKDIIEKTAKERGMSGSEGGHWIFPGVTLRLPKLSGSSSSTTTGSPSKFTAVAFSDQKQPT